MHRIKSPLLYGQISELPGLTTETISRTLLIKFSFSLVVIIIFAVGIELCMFSKIFIKKKWIIQLSQNLRQFNGRAIEM